MPDDTLAHVEFFIALGVAFLLGLAAMREWKHAWLQMLFGILALLSFLGAALAYWHVGIAIEVASSPLSYAIVALGLAVFIVLDRRKAIPNGPNAVWNDAMETINRRTFTNEHVILDGKTFHECEFINVSFMYHGTGPFRIDKSKRAGSIELLTDMKAIAAYHSLLHDMNASPGTNKVEYGVRNIETGGTHIARTLQRATDEPTNKP